MSTTVPPPPELPPLPKSARAAPTKMALAPKMDAAFLGRTYVTTLWLGAIWTVCAWGITQSNLATGSFAGGLLLGALLLKSQEIFVRRVLAPRAGVSGAEISGGDIDENAGKRDLMARIPIALLLPVKYIAIGLLFGLMIDRGWLEPILFAASFFAVQIVIFSKVIGRFVANSLRRADKDRQYSKQNIVVEN